MDPHLRLGLSPPPRAPHRQAGLPTFSAGTCPLRQQAQVKPCKRKKKSRNRWVGSIGS